MKNNRVITSILRQRCLVAAASRLSNSNSSVSALFGACCHQDNDFFCRTYYVRYCSSSVADGAYPKSTPLIAAAHHAPYSSSTAESSISNNEGRTVVIPTPDFNNTQTAYESNTTFELIRAMFTYRLTQTGPFIRRLRGVAGIRRCLTDELLKVTLFQQFYVHKDEIQPTIEKLKAAGIGCILDYVDEDDEVKSDRTNVYGWEMEEARCDRQVETYKKCIHHSAENMQKDGFAAIKATTLIGNPNLLVRMSRIIVEIQNIFAKFDVDFEGYISKEEFELGLMYFFQDNKDVHNHFKKIAEDFMAAGVDSNKIDYITWSMLLKPSELHKIATAFHQNGPGTMMAPMFEEEVKTIERMYRRGHTLAKEAAAAGIRLLFDEEPIRFQPAIHSLVLDLQLMYNASATTDYPIICSTYQGYLKDTGDRLRADVERSERYGYHFAAKMVRGAYMENERARADSLGLLSPIHDTIQDTHDSYNGQVKFLLEHSVKSKQKVEVMCATHNQESIELAIEAMNMLGIDHESNTICFSQKFGMMDNLTFNLGKHGFRAYKHMAYGTVETIMPYLVHANENSSIIARAARNDLKMIEAELSRRMFGRKMMTT